jgi:enoyl-CoA hydratase/carnithine racemase
MALRIGLAADFRIAPRPPLGLPESKSAPSGGGGTQRLSRLIASPSEGNDLTRTDYGAASPRIRLVMMVARRAHSRKEKPAALPPALLAGTKMPINRSQEVDLATGLEFSSTFGGLRTLTICRGTKAFLENETKLHRVLSVRDNFKERRDNDELFEFCFRKQ